MDDDGDVPAGGDASDSGAADEADAALGRILQGWKDDLAAAGIRVDGPDDDGWLLLPAILSAPDERLGPMMEFVPDHLYATVGVFGPTPRGTIGWRHIAHNNGSVAGVSANMVLLLASDNLRTGLTMSCLDERPTADSVIELYRDGGGAAAALVLPSFPDTLGEQLGTDRLVVGVPCQDVAWVTGADSAGVDTVRRYVRQHTHTDYLVPSIYLVADGRIELLDGLDDRRPGRPLRQIHSDGGMFVTFNPTCPEPAGGAGETLLSELWPAGASR